MANNQIEEHAQMLANAETMIKSMQTPQAIRDLQTFDGNPVKLHSFIRSVENLLPFIDALVDTPFHDVWLQAVRNKIVGDADNILEVYGTKLNWPEIKANLIAYYNDKRDAVTLTRELFTLQQTTSIEEFYGKVQHVLSLLVNHVNIEIEDVNVRSDRVSTYTDNALQVFLAGLKEPIGGNIRARQPKTLKEAFDACMEEQNFLRKAGLGRDAPPRPPKNPFLTNEKPAYHIPKMPFYPGYMPLPPPRPHVFAPNPTFGNRGNFSQKPNSQNSRPTPMDVDRSIRSRNVNYMNRPPSQRFPPRPFQNQPPPRRFPNPFPPRQPQPFPMRQEPRFVVEELTNTEHEYNPFLYYPDEYYHYYNPSDSWESSPSSSTWETSPSSNEAHDPSKDEAQVEPTNDEINFCQEEEEQPET